MILIVAACIQKLFGSIWILRLIWKHSERPIKGESNVVRPEVIRKRMNKLDEYLSILNNLRKYSYDDFTCSPERYGSAERFLQLSIEAILDMGNHVIADSDLGIVNWYSDIPAILEKKGYLDSRLKKEWLQMIGFRNTLVHDYVEIDRRIVYDVLQNHLKDFEEIKQVFARFL